MSGQFSRRLFWPEGTIASGVALMCLSVFFAPLIDIFSKLATTTLPAGEITAARFMVQTLVVLPFALMRGQLFSRSLRLTLWHMLRGALIVVGMTAFVSALKWMPVADAIAIFFAEPAILTILSAVLLREHVGRSKIIACAAGFAGSLMVIQPSFSEFGWVSLLPLITAFTVAFFMLVTRMLAGQENPWTMQFQSGFWGALIVFSLLAIGKTTGIALYDPKVPDVDALLFMVAAGLAATVSGILSVYACRAAPASLLAPLQYFEIVSASILAYVVFSDFPDLLTWIGIAVIIASGLFNIWHGEGKKAQPAEVCV